MVLVPAGPFSMGLDDHRVDADERRVHSVEVSAFYIDKYEVTNARFAEFVEATGHMTSAEEEGTDEREDGISWRHPEGEVADGVDRSQHPVVYASWYDAQAYCAWRGKRLPTEAEWEKSARGTDRRIFPWGNRFEAGRANARRAHRDSAGGLFLPGEEFLWSGRYGRQCVGVVRRLVRGGLLCGAAGGGSAGAGGGAV